MALSESSTALLVDELASYLAKKVRNDDDASDLAQEAFLRMHKFQCEQDTQLDNARAFLFKTANNLAIDQLRRERVHDRYLSSEMLPAESDEEDDKFAPSAERTVSAEQELGKIYEVVDRMPPKVRRAFLLHRGRDMSYSKIAEDMQVSTSMVEKYVIEALRLLRTEFR